MPERPSPPAEQVPRHAESRVREAMRDTRIVALVGPRQSGKTTLARKIAADTGLAVLTLDDGQTRSFANSDPSGFLRAITELSKLIAHSVDPPLLSHYRDRDKVEVDFVIERAGSLVGIEVKAAATVQPADFRGLRRLREAGGGAFACGIVLHDGDRLQRVGDRLFAMPVAELWSRRLV